MKILFITTKSPYPLYEGRALRTYNLIKQVSRQHDVILLTFVQTEEELAGVDHMRSICAHVEAFPLHLGGRKRELLADIILDLFSIKPLLANKYRSRAMRRRIQEILHGQDIALVHLDMLHLGEYARLCREKPIVLVEHNVESLLLRRRVQQETNWLAKAYLYLQYLKLRRYEKRVCRTVDHVVTVSEQDARDLKEMAESDNFTSIPNGVDTSYFHNTAPSPEPNTLVYVGGLGWFPNYDAIKHFAESILPEIVRELPDVKLTVIGKTPDRKKLQGLADNPHIRFAGLVEDIRPILARTAAYIVPLRVGGGTRLKILDALAMEQAIVSTSIGCEGLDVQHGENILIADEPKAFAAEVVRLLRDRKLAHRLGAAGRKLAHGKYEWTLLAKQLERVYTGVLRVRSDEPRPAEAERAL